jgi:hypothetical protein
VLLIEHRAVETLDWGGRTWPLDTLGDRKKLRDRFKDEYLAAPSDRQDGLLRQLGESAEVALPDRLPEDRRFLSWEEAAAIAADGPMELGSHGARHVDMTRLGDAELEREVDDALDRIRERTGIEARAFSYPDGRHDARVRRAVARRHDCAFALTSGARRSDPMRLPRLPALPAGEAGIRRTLSPAFRPRLALWQARARLGLT